MSATWYGDDSPPSRSALTLWDWCRAIVKGVSLIVVIFGGLAVLLVLRLIERPVFGQKRPVTPYITVFVCRVTLRILGISLHVEGAFSGNTHAVVANHSSWLDIFVLNAVKRVYFVSKAEVASWPGIGWLAHATGTVFIERDRTKAQAQTELLRERLALGHMLLFFPEGTSSDGQRVLPFKSSLFSAFVDPAFKDRLQIQPASISYQAPNNRDARFFGWWGDMDFGSHFLQVLAFGRGGQVSVRYHAPIVASALSDRKRLAAACEAVVRDGCRVQG